MKKNEYFKICNEPNNSDLDFAIKLFKNNINFLKGVVDLKQLPITEIKEVCFAGRSNCGKSTLLNAISENKKLARVSNTPGRTQEINFFLIKKKIFIVDLPGYGYAKAPKSKIENWQKKTKQYLSNRANLIRVYLLIDVRRGITKNDHSFMKILDQSAVNFQLVITKSDKSNTNELKEMTKKIFFELNEYVTAFPEVIITSSKKKIGINCVRSSIAKLIEF